MARWPARSASWRRRLDGPHPPARRHTSADGVQPCRPRIHRRPGTAGATRPQLRRPDTPHHLHRPRRLRHRIGPPARCSLRRGADVPRRQPSVASRSRTTPCSATPAALRWSDPDGSVDWLCVPRFDGRPVFGRLVGGPTAGSFGLAPARPIGLASRRYRPETVTLETTWNTDAGPLTLTEGMVAEVSGELLPSTMLVRRLTASDGPVEAVIDVRPSPRGAAPASPRPAPRPRPDPGLQLADHGHRAQDNPSLAGSARSVPHGDRDSRPTVHLRADRRRPRTPHLRRPRCRLGRAPTATNCAGGPGVATSTRRFPNATRWFAAC